MSSATTYPVDHRKPGREIVLARMTGAGAANGVNADSAKFGGGEISSYTRTGAGTFTLAFRRKWPNGRFLGGANIGTTAGLSFRLSAFDPAAGTGTLVCEVGAVATDPAATDTITLTFLMGNTIVD